jgi:hypothetical protein
MPSLALLGAGKQVALRGGSVLGNVITHVFAQDLRGGPPLGSAQLDKFLSQLTFDAQPQSGVFDFQGHDA